MSRCSWRTERKTIEARQFNQILIRTSVTGSMAVFRAHGSYGQYSCVASGKGKDLAHMFKVGPLGGRLEGGSCQPEVDVVPSLSALAAPGPLSG